ncbi:MAG: hypothetical protein R2831_10410 [Chitinophagaceae bacterium]
MKTISIIFLSILFSSFCFSQNIISHKQKTPSNKALREIVLNTVRTQVLIKHHQSVLFEVICMNQYKNYIWFRGNALKKDGRPIEISDDEAFDCCHVEALLKKINGHWTLIEFGDFSTDAWWVDLWKKYKLPKKMF